MKPVTNRRFWFYSNWEGGFARAGDEYGHHTFVIPFGKGRAVVIAYRAGYKGFFKCEDCVEGRKQTLEWEQDVCYAQTYWNIENYDDALDLENWDWNEALGV